MFLIKWIDEKFDDIRNSRTFYDLFAGREMEMIESNNYLFNPEKGIDIVMTESMIVTAIHLFSGNTAEAKRFGGQLINNIQFEMTQEVVQANLGTPNKKGGGYVDIFGNVPKWDKYYFDTYSLHLQYSESTGIIDIITIATLKLEPYFNSLLQ